MAPEHQLSTRSIVELGLLHRLRLPGFQPYISEYIALDLTTPHCDNHSRVSIYVITDLTICGWATLYFIIFNNLLN